MGPPCANLISLRPNHCRAHCVAHAATALYLYTDVLAVAVQYEQSKSLSPETAASVMARPGSLCIATATVLVILAATVQPGEPFTEN